jgi:hypothetical protein
MNLLRLPSFLQIESSITFQIWIAWASEVAQVVEHVPSKIYIQHEFKPQYWQKKKSPEVWVACSALLLILIVTLKKINLCCMLQM